MVRTLAQTPVEMAGFGAALCGNRTMMASV